MEIRRIQPLSLAKVFGILYAIIGLMIGIVMLGATLLAPGPQGLGRAIMFGMVSPLVFPLLYGVLGFVGGYVGAFLYNSVAKYVGGIVIETSTADTGH